MFLKYVWLQHHRHIRWMFPDARIVRTLHIALPGSSSSRLLDTRTSLHGMRIPCSPRSLRYCSRQGKGHRASGWMSHSSCRAPGSVLLLSRTRPYGAHLRGHRHGHLKGEGSAHPPPTAPLPSPPTAYIPQLQSCMQLGMALPAFNHCCCLAAASWNLLS